MTEAEVPLPGGHANTVYRVGDTVRRNAGSHTPAVQAVLRYVERVGFDGTPQVIGFDDKDREVLGYIEGEVAVDLPAPPYAWSERTLVGTAHLLRRYHDAVEGFVPPADARWNAEFADPAGGPIICHNDVDQWNLVFRGGSPVALIDWDFAAPGRRVWDVAVAARSLVPIADDDSRLALGCPSTLSAAARLRTFCEAYGITDGRELVVVLGDVLRLRYERRRRQAQTGTVAYREVSDVDVLDEMQRDIAYYSVVRRDLEATLCES